MEERQVEVIKKVEGPVIRDRRLVGKPLTITRKRVAAYVRVSTNAEEQLQSFKSQKEYYQDKISANKEWALVGIYADEGIMRQRWESACFWISTGTRWRMRRWN